MESFRAVLRVLSAAGLVSARVPQGRGTPPISAG
jgi:hypothetical protein